MLLLPYPFSGSCLLLIHMLSLSGDRHFLGQQQQWRKHSACPAVSWMLPLLSPAPHFHYIMRTFFCPIAGSFGSLGSWQEQQKCVICAVIYSGSTAAHMYTCAHDCFPQTLPQDMYAQKRRQSPCFQERQGKLSTFLAPRTSGQKVRPSTHRRK